VHVDTGAGGLWLRYVHGVLAAVVGLRWVMVVVERLTVLQLAAQVWIEGLTVDSS